MLANPEYVRFAALTVPSGSALKLPLRMGCGFNHSRPDIHGVYDLEELNRILAPLAPFSVNCLDFKTFSDALQSAINYGNGSYVHVRGKDDKFVCHVDLR